MTLTLHCKACCNKYEKRQGARTLLGAPGLTTTGSNKKLLGAPARFWFRVLGLIADRNRLYNRLIAYSNRLIAESDHLIAWVEMHDRCAYAMRYRLVSAT